MITFCSSAAQLATQTEVGSWKDGSAQHHCGAHAQLSAPRTAAAQPRATSPRRVGVTSPHSEHGAAAGERSTPRGGRRREPGVFSRPQGR